MTETGLAIADAQAVLDQAYGLVNDLALGNVDGEHEAAYEDPDERRRRLDDFRHGADTCRSQLEQRFSGDDPIVELWVRAIDSIRFMIDMAYEGRYPTTHMGDSQEFSEAEAAAEHFAEDWQQAVKRTLGADPA